MTLTESQLQLLTPEENEVYEFFAVFLTPEWKKRIFTTYVKHENVIEIFAALISEREQNKRLQDRLDDILYNDPYQ